jgi:hypothetical protein
MTLESKLMSFDSKIEYFHSLSSVGTHLATLQCCVMTLGRQQRHSTQSVETIPTQQQGLKKWQELLSKIV